MSSTMKFGLLAMVSAAAAVPHYGGYAAHSKFHHKPSGQQGTGAPLYPTGVQNATIPQPTGTGSTGEQSGEFTTTIDLTSTTITTVISTIPQPTGTGSTGEQSGEFTTTIDLTSTTITTVISTIHGDSKPSEGAEAPSSSVLGQDAPSGGAGSCAPPTVYVTETNKVTVTVTPGGGAGSTPVETPVTSAGDAGDFDVSAPVATPSSTGSQSASTWSIETGFSFVPTAPATTGIETPKETPETPKETPAESPKDEATPTPSSSVVESSPASSSKAPTETNAPTYGGGKRGLAYNDASLCSAFEGKAGWAYNWGSAPGDIPTGIKYYPMSWADKKGSTAEKWLSEVKDAVEKHNADVVIGFNEPDQKEQADMTPQIACDKWTEFMEPVAKAHPDVTILGPSVTNAGPENPTMGLNWLKSFQETCPEATWHAANQHFYDIYEEGEGDLGTIGRFEKKIKAAHTQTGKPVWVTEFGLNPGSCSDEQAAKFLGQAIKFLEGADYVAGYSYFMVGTGQYQLNKADGLSAIGEVYSG